MQHETKHSSELNREYNELIKYAILCLGGARVDRRMFLQQDNPNFIEDLSRDAKFGIQQGLWTEEEVLGRLNSGKHIGFLVQDVFNKCKSHCIVEVERDIGAITKFSKVEKDNIVFETHKLYLEHCVSSRALKPYLDNSKVTVKLTAIYKHEEQQKEQELTKQKELALEKEYGKGGFGM